MDWKAIGNIAAFVGVLVAMVVMFNQVNGRLDRMQAETNARFDAVQTETNARFDKMFDRQDRMQAETNTRFDAVNARFDMVLEAIATLDGRVSRIEGWIEGRFDDQSVEAPAP